MATDYLGNPILDLSSATGASTAFPSTAPVTPTAASNAIAAASIFPSSGMAGPTQNAFTLPSNSPTESTFSVQGQSPISINTPPPVPVTVTGANTTPTTPFNVPPPPPSPTSTIASALAVNQPVNPTLLTPDGTSAAPIPAPINGATPIQPAPPTVNQKYNSTIQDLLTQLNGRSQTTQDLQNTYDLAGKTTDAQRTYNAYQQAQVALAQQLETLRTSNPTGQLDAAHQAEIANVEKAGNANLANLAIIAQAASGNLTAAQNIIKSKLDALYQPIQDQIDYITKAISSNNADLTDSEKTQLENQRFQLQTNLNTIVAAKQAAHTFALQQGITDPNILAKIDSAQTPSDAYAAVNMNSDGTPSINTTGGNSALAGLPPQLSGYVHQASNGTNYVSQDKFTNLTPYQQQQAARQYSDANVTVVTPIEAGQLENIVTTKQNLGGLSDLLIGTKDANGKYAGGLLGSGAVGRVGSSISNFTAGITQSNPNIGAINNYSTLAINALQALGAGQNSRITQTEINNQLANIPTIYDSRETASKKVSILNTFLDNKQAQILPNSSSGSSASIGSLPIVQTKVGAINPNF